MTEKHVSLNVQPEHYDIVGECIIEAIKIVLKDSATKAQCSKILKKSAAFKRKLHYFAFIGL